MCKQLLLTTLVCLVVTACEIVCPAVFVSHRIRVVNSAGEFIALDTFEVKNLRTGRVYPNCAREKEVFPCLQPISDTPTWGFEIMNDGFKTDVRRSGTTIRVAGTKGGLSFSEDYVFRSNTCGVAYVSGALTITLE